MGGNGLNGGLEGSLGVCGPRLPRGGLDFLLGVAPRGDVALDPDGGHECNSAVEIGRLGNPRVPSLAALSAPSTLYPLWASRQRFSDP